MNIFLKYKSILVSLVLNISTAIVVISVGKNSMALAICFSIGLLLLIIEINPSIKSIILSDTAKCFNNRWCFGCDANPPFLINTIREIIFNTNVEKKVETTKICFNCTPLLKTKTNATIKTIVFNISAIDFIYYISKKLHALPLPAVAD